MPKPKQRFGFVASCERVWDSKRAPAKLAVGDGASGGRANEIFYGTKRSGVSKNIHESDRIPYAYISLGRCQNQSNALVLLHPASALRGDGDNPHRASGALPLVAHTKPNVFKTIDSIQNTCYYALFFETHVGLKMLDVRYKIFLLLLFHYSPTPIKHIGTYAYVYT